MGQTEGDVMVAPQQTFAARLEIDYPERLDRVTTLFRVFLIIPIAIVLSLVSATRPRPRSSTSRARWSSVRRAPVAASPVGCSPPRR